SQGFPADRMIVIPNGIDTERFRVDLDARRRVRAEWCVGEEEKLVGLVGRIDPVKDHPTFLRAAALVRRERADVRFVCVGSGQETHAQALLELAEQLGLQGRVLWTGARHDMPSVYNALDILCSASFVEGFSNSIGEAMSCGVVSVVT